MLINGNYCLIRQDLTLNCSLYSIACKTSAAVLVCYKPLLHCVTFAITDKQ